MTITNPYRAPNSISVIAAPVGSRLYPEHTGHREIFEHPDVIPDPEQLADYIAGFYRDGLISQAHVHARHPQTGEPTGNAEHYEALLRAFEARDLNGYLSVTTTDNNMPAADKTLYGELHARGAVLRMPEDAPQPDRVPIIDALSMALRAKTDGTEKNLANPVREFQNWALDLMEQKGIGFEIEVPNYHLIEVAKEFLPEVRRGLEEGRFSPNGSVAQSLDGPVVQILFGARENMPVTREHLNKVVNEVLEAFSPRAVQVAFRGEGNRYDPDFVEAILDLVQEGKVTGIRIGIEDSYLDERGQPMTTRQALEKVNAQIKARGLHLNTPEEAKRLLSAPIQPQIACNEEIISRPVVAVQPRGSHLPNDRRTIAPEGIAEQKAGRTWEVG